MLVPTQCYATFSRSFNPQILVGASSKALTVSARAVAVPLAASVTARHPPGVCTQPCCSHPGRFYSSLAAKRANGGNVLAHKKGCACPSCGRPSSVHGLGCGCNSCGSPTKASMSTVATGGSRPHFKGCGCASCGRTLAVSRFTTPHGSPRACASCRSVTTSVSRSHSGDCTCGSCSAPHASSCACPTCALTTISRWSTGSAHPLGCPCASCGGSGTAGPAFGAPLGCRRAYSSTAVAMAYHARGCGCSTCGASSAASLVGERRSSADRNGTSGCACLACTVLVV